jgi:hypothetical protein
MVSMRFRHRSMSSQLAPQPTHFAGDVPVRTLLEKPHEGGADDHAVGHRCGGGHLRGRRDSESQGDRLGGQRLETADERCGVGGQRVLLPGDAGAAHGVDESPRYLGYAPETGLGAGRRRQEHRVEARAPRDVEPARGFLGRNVGEQHAVHSGVAGGGSGALQPEPEHGVHVGEEKQGQLAPRAYAAGAVEDPRERRSGPEGPLARPLDDRSVGQGVRERDSQLEDVCAAALELEGDLDRPVQARVARRDEGDERLLPLGAKGREAFGDPCHEGPRSDGEAEALASSPPRMPRSLSPRPLRFTRTRFP